MPYFHDFFDFFFLFDYEAVSCAKVEAGFLLASRRDGAEFARGAK